MSSGDVTASLNYLQKLDIYQHEKPFEIMMDIPSDAKNQRQHNTKFEAREQTIRDIRELKYQFTLDKHGFMVREFRSTLDRLGRIDGTMVEGVYKPEVESLIREQVSDVDQVFFFEWRLRSGDIHIKEGDRIDLNDLSNWVEPAGVVHVDQSPAAVLNRVQLHMQEKAEYLLQGRVRIINVWKPLENPVEDFPLAVCDSSSMEPGDLTECDIVRKQFTGASLYAHFNPQQKWYYLSQQTPNEVLMLKIFDSQEDIEGKRCAHSAFKHPKYQAGLPPRKSIEIRALVFTHPRN
ncbi:methyltransferase CmcJ [Leptodontidium sp. 2 PMI_412]|nr:methyltransferase CmcJ [Leptodontidium sp. 2 PMI_412]